MCIHAARSLRMGLLLAITLLVLLLPATALAATIIVDSDADTVAADGQCTLREAIIAANTDTATGGCVAGNDVNETITFSFTAGSFVTISLQSALPVVTDTVSIDALQQLTVSRPGLIVDGSSAGANVAGIVFAPTSADSELRAVALNHFTGNGVAIEAEDVTIDRSWIGVDTTDISEAGNNGHGIVVEADRAFLLNNTIGDNALYGVLVMDADATRIEQNSLGRPPFQAVSLPNGLGDINLLSAPNTIMNDNVFGAILGNAITLDEDSDDVTIVENDSTLGAVNSPPAHDVLVNGASRTFIHRNVFVAFALTSVEIRGAGIGDTQILGNVIYAEEQGVLLNNVSSNMVVTNTFSGNGDGVVISGTLASNNDVYSNTFTNGNNSIKLLNAPDNTIGSATPGLGNRILVAANAGIYLTGLQATGNQILGNMIGGSKDTQQAVNYCILLENAPENQIGGTTAAAANHLFCSIHNIQLSGNDTYSNMVEGNSIGPYLDGTLLTDEGASAGIFLSDGAHDNRIGGVAAGAGNHIIGFRDVGISVVGVGVDNNQIWGNIICADATATQTPLLDDNDFHQFAGVDIADGSNNQVGGSDPTMGNIIGGCKTYAINVNGSNNLIQNNWIGQNPSGDPLPNVHGVGIQGGSHQLLDNSISNHINDGVLMFAGTVQIDGNQIAENGARGILLNGVVSNASARAAIGTVTPNTITGNCDTAIIYCAGIYLLDAVATNEATLTTDNPLQPNNGMPFVEQHWFGAAQIVVAGSVISDSVTLVGDDGTAAAQAALPATINATRTFTLSQPAPCSGMLNNTIVHGPPGATCANFPFWSQIVEFLIEENGTRRDFNPYTVVGPYYGGSYDFDGEGNNPANTTGFVANHLDIDGLSRFQVMEAILIAGDVIISPTLSNGNPANFTVDINPSNQNVPPGQTVLVGVGTYMLTIDGLPSNAQFTNVGGGCSLVDGELQLVVNQRQTLCTFTINIPTALDDTDQPIPDQELFLPGIVR